MQTNELELDGVQLRTPIDQVRWFDSVDSTNTAALADATTMSGHVLYITDNQQAGRGRRGADWWSGTGALTFSVLTDRPRLTLHEAPRVSLAVGLAICRAVEVFLPSSPVQLKWPNDVFVEGRKACGVLVEGASEAPERVVIGVGLNVNNPVAEAPDDLGRTAISMLDALGRPHEQPLDRSEVLTECLNQLFAALDEIASNSAKTMAEIDRRSFLSGRSVRIETPGAVVEGLCRGVAADGALVVETATGQRACYGGAVTRFE